jgi:hypothetical protein
LAEYLLASLVVLAVVLADVEPEPVCVMSAPIPAPSRAPTIVKASSIFFVISIFKFSFSLFLIATVEELRHAIRQQACLKRENLPPIRSSSSLIATFREAVYRLQENYKNPVRLI